jgi:FtsP/CotA-like multicopper oxidase with cupredoxin domain
MRSTNLLNKLRGDWLLFKITNELTDEGTALHAHGLFQANTSWYDGVPAVAQCPITPNGGTFEMLFRADRYGTSWYHSKIVILSLSILMY